VRAFRRLMLVVLLCLSAPDARAGEHRWSVSLYGDLITASKLFPNPNARDDIIRGSFSPIDPVYGLGADLRCDVPALGVMLGLGAEYIAGSFTSAVPNTQVPIPIEDGYLAVPVELTGYFTIPVGGERVGITMGGGAGVYFGERRYRYAGVDAVTLDRHVTPGIHVLTGVEYRVDERFSLRTEIKFRNAQLETDQEFPAASAVYEGVTVPLPQGRFSSRVQVDGMHLSLGVVYHFL
jgi:hypothetical protein